MRQFLSKSIFFFVLIYLTFPTITSAGNTLVIDPGHGGQFDGTCGYSGEETGFCEKDANLLVALKLREILERTTDITVYMTRTEDVDFVEDTSVPVWHEDRLKEDMENRVKIANAFVKGNHDNSLFLSIHHNRDIDSSETRGLETYYYDGVNNLKPQFPPHPLQIDFLEDNRRFGEIIHDNLLASLGLRDRELRNDQSFYVLREAQMPAVLVELGFMTNPEEEELIRSEAFQQRAAEALAASVVTYFQVYEVIEFTRDSEEKRGTFVDKKEAIAFAESLDSDSVIIFFKKTGQRVYPRASQKELKQLAFCNLNTTKRFFGKNSFHLLPLSYTNWRQTGYWCQPSLGRL